MLTAGDEFGRSQGGNNNAYAQDNAVTWLDWEHRDTDLEAFAASLAALRRAHPELGDPRLLTGLPGPDGVPDVTWLTPKGAAKTAADWEAARTDALAMVLAGAGGRLAVLVNRRGREVGFRLPPRDGFAWEGAPAGGIAVAARTLAFVRERPGGHPPSGPHGP
jgi:glycogen operon protein